MKVSPPSTLLMMCVCVDTFTAVAALGIPTTRSLALLTHDPSISVMRENGPELPSLLARVAPSFIRIGHFEALNPGRAGHNTHQFFLGNSGWMSGEEDDSKADESKGPLGGQGNLEGLRELTNWCQHLMSTDGGVKGWVREVIRRNAEMVAGWQVSEPQSTGGCPSLLGIPRRLTLLGVRLDARGAQQRQHQYTRPDDRLRAICIHGRLGRTAYLQYGCTLKLSSPSYSSADDPPDHSDPSGLYSYKAQPSRVLWDLDKLVQCVAPLVGYESIHGSLSPGFADTASKADVENWTQKGLDALDGFEKDFYHVERDAEQRGWMSVRLSLE